jgi:hypothetical protein
MTISSSMCFRNINKNISPFIHHIIYLCFKYIDEALKELCQIPLYEDAKGLIKK